MTIVLQRILILALIVYANFGYTQFSPETPTLDPTLTEFIPASPEVSALMKFSNIPVSEATGIPSVQIPIYTYSNASKDLNLPVSLNYHAGGVRLNEPSSSVGLSWSLMAGGVISRIVRGIYDEKPYVGFLYQDVLPDETEGNSPGEISERPFNDMYGQVLDSQSDIFSISVPGLSAKFMLGKNGDILVLDQSKIRIEKTIGNVVVNGSSLQLITGFVVTNIDGTKYVFSDYEVTTNLGSGISNKYTSSWYLSKIISPVSPMNAISFNYVDDHISGYSTSHYQESYRRVDGFGGERTSSVSSTQNIAGKFLQNIVFPNGIGIDFYYDTNGVNNIIGRRLHKIEITDGSNLRGFLLEHDYSLNRLTLKKVIPFGGSVNNTDSPYIFEYIGSLPDRFTEIPDHWGYYRGNSGGSYIPEEIFPNGLGAGVFELPGGSRDTDPNYIKNGSLRKITYPTGGYKVFDMSANEAIDNWLDKEFQISVVGNSYSNKSKTEYITSDDPYKSVYVDMVFEGLPNTNTVVEFSYSSIGGSGPCPSSSCGVVAEIYKSTDLSIGNLLEVIEVPYNEMFGKATFNLPGLIHGNTYRIVLFPRGLYDFACYATFNWKEQIEPESSTKTLVHRQPYVGGLRVNKITNYDGIQEAPVGVRSYKYVKEDGLTSSGTLGVHPVYSCTTYYANKNDKFGGYWAPNPAPEDYISLNANVIIRRSSPLFDLSTYNGSPVIYKRVEIIDESPDGTNGKEVKYFTNYEDSPVVTNSTPFPFIPIDVENWKYGLLTKHLIYNNQNVLTKQVDKIYSYRQDTYFQKSIRKENFKSVSIAPVYFFSGTYKPSPTDIPPLGIPIYFLSNSFYPSAGRSDIEKIIETTYNNSNTLKEVTEFAYNEDYYLLENKTTTNSRGNIYTQNYTFPFDMLGENDPAGVHQSLLDLNNISTLIKQSLSVANKTLIVKQINYKDWGNNRILPEKVLTSKGNENMEPRVEYLSYDSYGNPTGIKKTDGSVVSYFWGYNGQYPIAKIENATYQEVATALSTTTAALKSYTESDLATINSLRSILPNAQVTTYTYEPLVGVKSITNPKGYTTKYEYDDFNRLGAVKDQEGNLLEDYKYHYKN